MTDFPKSMVWLVGAGPGDPGLLTRKAYAAIATAEVLFYDDLVSADPDVADGDDGRLRLERPARQLVGRRDPYHFADAVHHLDERFRKQFGLATLALSMDKNAKNQLIGRETLEEQYKHTMET